MNEYKIDFTLSAHNWTDTRDRILLIWFTDNCPHLIRDTTPHEDTAREHFRFISHYISDIKLLINALPPDTPYKIIY